MPRRTSIRIAYAAVDGGRDYRERALHEEDARVQDFTATVNALGETLLDLLMFPAGYFQVRDGRARDVLERKLRRHLALAAPNFGVIVGVDVGAVTTRKGKRCVPEGHPFFVLYRRVSGEHLWMQQASVNSKEGRDHELLDGRWGERDVLLAGTDIAFLICGESWSDVLVDINVALSEARVLAVAAHSTVKMHRKKAGHGKLSWHLRLAAFARKHQLPVVLSEHTRSPNRHAYAWPARTAQRLALEGVPGHVTLRLGIIR
jgi:hypothetical protein